MISLAFTLFVAGLLTILLPCILPLIPIVLGISIADKNKWRPLITIVGMLVSFVGSVFILQVLLSQFVELSDYIRIGSYYLLLLFGLGFLTHNKYVQLIGAALGSVFFWEKGWIAVIAALVLGVIAMELGGRIATRIQQFGTDVQTKARTGLGNNSSLTAFIIGLTMGLVWVPCAGPALSFALTLVRNQPGFLALAYLACYGLGAAVPLLLIGYGGQAAVQSAKALNKYTGIIKQVSGAILILSALAFQFNWFIGIQTALTNLGYGNGELNLEQKLFERGRGSSSSSARQLNSSAAALSQTTSSAKALLNSSVMAKGASSIPSTEPVPSSLPIIGQEPHEFAGLGPWHNSPPLTLESLRGKVVLIDFWTYSCINCIRTLPYEEATWQTFKGQPFVLIGVHTPEFTFEKSERNVSAAIKEHGLTYPVAQDNDYKTWNAFNNQYWPAKYLIDAKGNIRYTHFGEGGYEETDQAIASLLGEIGHRSDAKASMPTEQQQANKKITPETYLHSRGWDSFGNSQGAPDTAEHTYTAPATMELHKFYLAGTWQLVADERQVLQSTEGEIRIRALAGEVNLVMGLEGSVTSVKADIEIDGKPSKSITIDHHDLYNLYKGMYGQHDVVLKIHGKGVSAYAFTFGS